MSATLLVLALLPLAGAAVPLALRGRFAFPLAAALLGIVAALDAWLLVATPPGSAILVSRPWAPALDLTLALRFDHLSGATALLIVLIAVGELWRMRSAAAPAPSSARGCGLLVLLAGLAQACALAENALLLVAFSEMAAIAAFALAADAKELDAGARAALYVRSAGALALLAAVLLLADSTGSLEFGRVLGAGASLREQPLSRLLVALVLASAWSCAGGWPWVRRRWIGSAGFAFAALLATGVHLVARLWPLVGGVLPVAAIGAGFVAVPFGVAALERALERGVGADEATPPAASVADARK